MKHAILLAVLADGLLSFMDALIKMLVARYPTLEIAFLRFAFGAIWAAALVGIARPGWPTRETVFYNLTRSVLVVMTATSFFYALGQLPLADAVALSFVSPMFLALFGSMFLNERVDKRIALALVAGAAGMLLIAGGRIGSGTYTEATILGVAACTVSAVSYALALVLLRARALRDALPIIVLFQNLGPAVLLAVPAWIVWTPLSREDVVVLVLISGLGVAGHYMLALAFARAEAARLAPVQYTTLIWGALFGYLFFSDVPGGATWLGASLIVAGAIVTQAKGSKPKGDAKRDAGRVKDANIQPIVAKSITPRRPAQRKLPHQQGG
jgi:S-adenosylmethionine uptake transporter